MIRTLEEMEKLVLSQPKQTLALASAMSEESILAVEEARAKGCIDVHLVGDEDFIRSVCEKHGIDMGNFTVTDEKDPATAAEKAVRLVSEGKAGLVMKGQLDTSDFLRAVMNKEWGLRTKDRMCGISLIECKVLNRMLILADVGTNIAPDVKTKASILESCFTVARAMGIEDPKAAVLCAVEKPNDKMPCTLEAAELKQMYLNGELSGITEGPISMDLAVNPRSAQIKKYEGLVKGDADILLAPDIEAGNILIKALLNLTGDIRSAGVGMGSRVPLIQTSRADDHETKYFSIILAAMISQHIFR